MLQAWNFTINFYFFTRKEAEWFTQNPADGRKNLDVMFLQLIESSCVKVDWRWKRPDPENWFSEWTAALRGMKMRRRDANMCCSRCSLLLLAALNLPYLWTRWSFWIKTTVKPYLLSLQDSWSTSCWGNLEEFSRLGLPVLPGGLWELCETSQPSCEILILKVLTQ